MEYEPDFETVKMIDDYANAREAVVMARAHARTTSVRLSKHLEAQRDDVKAAAILMLRGRLSRVAYLSARLNWRVS